MRAIGIDESKYVNKSGINLNWEVHVAVCSENEDDLKEHKPRLDKIRDHGKNLDQIVNGRSFAFIFMQSKEYNKRLKFGKEIIIYSEFIKTFNPDIMIIDGKFPVDQIEKQSYKPIIKAEPGADVRYGLVNKADEIASFLFKHFKSGGNGLYSQYQITPNMDNYSHLIKPRRVIDNQILTLVY